MTKDDLSARVRAIITDLLCLEPHEVRDDSAFSDLTDDFGRLEIVMAAEDIADVEISDDDMEGLATVGDLVSYLAGRLGLVEVAA